MLMQKIQVILWFFGLFLFPYVFWWTIMLVVWAKLCQPTFVRNLNDEEIIRFPVLFSDLLMMVTIKKLK